MSKDKGKRPFVRPQPKTKTTFREAYEAFRQADETVSATQDTRDDVLFEALDSVPLPPELARVAAERLTNWENVSLNDLRTVVGFQEAGRLWPVVVDYLEARDAAWRAQQVQAADAEFARAKASREEAMDKAISTPAGSMSELADKVALVSYMLGHRDIADPETIKELFADPEDDRESAMMLALRLDALRLTGAPATVQACPASEVADRMEAVIRALWSENAQDGLAAGERAMESLQADLTAATATTPAGAAAKLLLAHSLLEVASGAVTQAGRDQAADQASRLIRSALDALGPNAWPQGRAYYLGDYSQEGGK